MIEEALLWRAAAPNVEILEAHLPLGASLHEKRLVRQSMGKMVADKIMELDAFEMVPGPGGEWVLRCRLIIHFAGAGPKLKEVSDDR